MSERRVAVVSGGSRGLGRALVEDLLNAGCSVTTFSRSSTPFIERCQQQADGRFCWKSLDAADPEAVRGFAREAIRRFGRIDALINNAASGTGGLLSTMRVEEITQSINLNLQSALQLTSSCVKAMLAQGSGSVINISSVNGLRGHTGASVYSATKAALDGFTRSLAREVGAAGIRVNSIAPGYFASDMTEHFSDEARARIIRRTPLGRLGVIDDIVGVVRFLLSPDADFITGQVIAVDGGFSC